MQVRTGLVGAGAFGANHAGKLAALPRSFYQGVYDADPARAQASVERHGGQAFASFEALLAEVDAVIIATPARTHAAVAGAAIAAGKHVLVEKPLAATKADADTLVAAAKAKGVALQAGHQERFQLAALGLFDAPEKPLRIESVREGPFTGRSMDVSVTFDLMIHDLDLVALLFGGAPTRIEARGRAEKGAHFDDVDARLTFASGEAHFHASRIAEARKRTLRATYPSGEVTYDYLAQNLTNTTAFALDSDFASKVTDPLGRAVAEFLDAIVEGKASAIPGESGAAAVGLAEAVDLACARA